MKDAIFIPNNPNAPRLCPELAFEIGLNESILLLQIEFWIRTSTTEEHDGKRWTYQSITEIQEFFPFWSTATINRAIQSLIDKQLVIIGNFNKAKYDKTRWFSINHTECAKLNSIRVGGHDTRSTQNDTGSNQNDTRSTQNDTTIPEITTEITTEKAETGTARDEKNVFALYEQNIGMLTPLMADELKEWEKEYPHAWFADAFNEAIQNNVRKPKYIRAILDRWKRDGRDAMRSPPARRESRGKADQIKDAFSLYEEMKHGKRADHTQNPGGVVD